MNQFSNLDFSSTFVPINKFNDFNSNLDKNHFVIIGPLNQISKIVFKPDISYFGLSWGFDFENTEEIIKYSNIFEGIIVDSLSNFNKLIDYGLDTDKIFFIPWGVPSKNILEPHDIDSKNYFENGKVNILLPRNHEPIYNNVFIIESLLDLPNYLNYHITIVGEGSQTNYLLNKLRSSKLKECFTHLGRIDEKQFIEVLDVNDIMISASLVDGSSVSLLQAMARGLPVLANETENNRDWLTHNLTGFLFNPLINGDLMNKFLFAINSNLKSTALSANHLISLNANWEINFESLTQWLNLKFTKT
jgi:glycosyltransferase involved in cell wall biosynthesis